MTSSVHFVVEQRQTELFLDDDGDSTVGHCLTPIYLDLIAVDHDEERQVAGSLQFYRLSALRWSPQHVFDALDSVDDDTAAFLSILEGLNGEPDPYNEELLDQLGETGDFGPVALVHTLSVRPQWQGRGLGAALLAHALDYHMDGYCYALLRAFPMQFGGSNAACGDFSGTQEECTAKLVKVYERLGFKVLAPRDEHTWMGLSFAYDYSKEWRTAITAAK